MKDADARNQMISEVTKDEILRDDEYQTLNIRKKINKFLDLTEKEEVQKLQTKINDQKLKHLDEKIRSEIEEKKKEVDYEQLENQIRKAKNDIAEIKVKPPSCDSEKDAAIIKKRTIQIRDSKRLQKEILDSLKQNSKWVKEKQSIEDKKSEIQLTPEETIDLSKYRRFFANIYNGDDEDVKNRCTGTIYECFSQKFKKAKSFYQNETQKVEKMKMLLEKLFDSKISSIADPTSTKKTYDYLVEELRKRIGNKSPESPESPEYVIDKLEEPFNAKYIKYAKTVYLDDLKESTGIVPEYFKLFSKEQFENATDTFYNKFSTKSDNEKMVKMINKEAWEGIGSNINKFDTDLLLNADIPKEVLLKLDKDKQHVLYGKNPKKYAFFEDSVKANKQIISEKSTIDEIKSALSNSYKQINLEEIKLVYNKIEQTVDENVKTELKDALFLKLTKENVNAIMTQENKDEIKKEKAYIVDLIIEKEKYSLFNLVQFPEDETDENEKKIKEGITELSYSDLLSLSKELGNSEETSLKHYVKGEIKKKEDEDKKEILPSIKNMLLGNFLLGEFGKKSNGFKYKAPPMMGGKCEEMTGGKSEEKDKSDESKTLTVSSNFNTEMFEKWIDSLEDEKEVIDIFKIINLNKFSEIATDPSKPAEKIPEIVSVIETNKKEIKKYNSSKNTTNIKNLENITNSIKSSLKSLEKNGIVKSTKKDEISNQIKNVRDYISYIQEYDKKVKDINTLMNDMSSKKESWDRISKGNSQSQNIVAEINSLVKKLNVIIESYFSNEMSNKTIKTTPTAEKQPQNASGGSPEAVSLQDIKEKASNSINKMIDIFKEILKKKGKSLGNKEDETEGKYSELWKKYVKDINDEDKQIEKSRDMFYKSFKANNLDPTDALVLTNDNRVVFVITIFIFRQISLAVTERLIESGYITTFHNSLFVYSVTYIFLILLTLLIVNIDEYKFRIIFNHFNMHNGVSKILYHVVIKLSLIIMLYSLANKMNPSMNKDLNKLSELDKMHLIYKLEIITISVFCLISIIEFM